MDVQRALAKAGLTIRVDREIRTAPLIGRLTNRLAHITRQGRRPGRLVD